MPVLIRPAISADAAWIEAHLRAPDRAEAEAMGNPIVASLIYGIAVSEAPTMAEADGAPIAVWGLVRRSLLSDTAQPWLLTCHAIARHRRAMVRIGLAQLAAWRDAGFELQGLVDARYFESRHWMQRAGFRLGATPVLVGPRRQPFHDFRRAA